MKIGVIGDDFTGSADIANTLAKAGARTSQFLGIPEQIVFKYCSTSDSTPAATWTCAEALLEELGETVALVCAALSRQWPHHLQSYLFVGDRLLHESGMGNHPSRR